MSGYTIDTVAGVDTVGVAAQVGASAKMCTTIRGFL
jgi:hypothetical protein